VQRQVINLQKHLWFSPTPKLVIWMEQYLWYKTFLSVGDMGVEITRARETVSTGKHHHN